MRSGQGLISLGKSVARIAICPMVVVMKSKSQTAFRRVLRALAIFLTLFCVACSSVKIEQGSYPMGVMLPLTGDDAQVANDALRGMELARDEINKAGGISGIPLSFVVRDMSDKDFDFADTINALRRSGVKVLNIGFDREVIFRHKSISACDDIFVNYLCTYAPVTLGAENSTRVFLNGAQVGDIMATAVDKTQQGERQIVIMNVDNFYGKSNADYLSFCVSSDKAKVYRDVFGRAEKNFDIFSEQIKRLWADYVFYVGDGLTLPDFVSSLSKSAYEKSIVANCGFYNLDFRYTGKSPFFRVETKFQQGKVATVVSQNFVKNYKARYGVEPSWVAACAYDGITLLAEAVKDKKFNPAQMRKFFINKIHNGAMGEIKFDSSADSTMSLELARKN